MRVDLVGVYQWCTYLSVCTCKAQELQVVGNVCEVTEGRTLLVVTQVSSGLKKIHILCKYKYFHVKPM